MDYRHMSRQTDPPGKYAAHSPPHRALLDWLQNPTVLIVVVGIVFTAFYQSLHTSPFNQRRHPGEVLWDFIITITPAALLYAIDDWLNPPMFPVAKSFRPQTFAAKSELLRKLLGMDKPGGGIIGSVTSAGKKSLSTLSGASFRKRDSNQPAGLGNTDYSCFQNSILQGLAALQPLPDYLNSAIVEHAEAESSTKDGSASTLQQLISQLKDHENNGKTLWTPAKLKSLHSWEQQDAQEYFSKLLDEIEKEVAKATKGQSKPPSLESALSKDDTESHHSDDSGYQSISTSSKACSEVKIVRNPLEGMTAQRVACVQCGYSDGLSLQPFNCITLNLGVGTMQHDLYELLDSYTQLESIEQVECNKCTLLKARKLLTMLLDRMSDKPEEVLREPRSRLEAVEQALEEDDFEEKTLKEKCKISAQHRSSSTKTKQVVIARPPRSLAIHVNRSVFDFNTGNMWKNLAAVRFPKTLDLGPWCLGSADHSAAPPKQTLVDAEKGDFARDQETWVSDPKSSMISGDHYPSKISGPLYELRAVVTHQGQHENGHYICFRKHSSPPPEGRQESPTTDATEQETKTFDDEKTLVDTFVGEEDEDQWWRLSDEHVWSVTEGSVLEQGGVFMLFYDCVDPNAMLASGLDGIQEETKEATVAEKAPYALQESECAKADAAAADKAVSDPLVKNFHDTTLASRLREAPASGTTAKDSTSFTGLGQTTTPSLVTGGPKEDGFVLGLLNRPNSTKVLLKGAAESDKTMSPKTTQFIATSLNESAESNKVMLSEPALSLEPGSDMIDSFVFGLLTRPNSSKVLLKEEMESDEVNPSEPAMSLGSATDVDSLVFNLSRRPNFLGVTLKEATEGGNVILPEWSSSSAPENNSMDSFIVGLLTRPNSSILSLKEIVVSDKGVPPGSTSSALSSGLAKYFMDPFVFDLLSRPNSSSLWLEDVAERSENTSLESSWSSVPRYETVDSFVSGLLTRPNSTQSSTKETAENPKNTPAGAAPPPASENNIIDSFVSPMLGRSNK